MPYRILIADDDLHTRRILETLLQREPSLGGPEIIPVADGQEAMASLEKTRPDLVITDLLMPKMDGFALARAMRLHKNGAGVPLLVTSAIYKDRSALGKLEQETGAEFFAKPYQLRELVRAVLRHLAEPHKARRVPRVAASTPAPSLEEGPLGDRPLPRLLLELFEKEATGVLTIRRAQLRKDIFVFLGHPIGADSNLRNETLGQLLLARGALEPEKLQQALELSKSGRDRLGAILVEKGWMKEGDVLQFLAAQVRLKIVTALRWGDGDYRFVPGDSFSGRMTHLTVDAPRVVFAGLKKSAHVEEIARQAAGAQGRVVLSPRFSRHREAFTRAFSEQHLAIFDERPRAADLAATGNADLLAAWDALRLTGLAELAVGATDVTGPRRRTAPPTRAPDRGEALYRQLFGDEEGLAATPQSVNLSTEDSGVFALPFAPNGNPAPAPPLLRAARDALLRVYLSIHSHDHYQLLHVPRDAGTAEIARAYQAQRDEFRVERFHGYELGRDHARLEALHEALREAYETLSDPQRRAGYDRALSAPPSQPSGAGRVVEAEARFHDALRLLADGQAAQAAERLREAVNAAPDQADYHALRGWALFLSRGGKEDPASAATTEEALASMTQALAIDPDHVAAHEFIGRVAFVVGDDKAAAESLERALSLDPARPEALETLEAVHLRTSDHARLERLYRSLIARLGDQRAAALWWKLGVVLRDQRRDRAGARLAIETYLRLVPDDAGAKEALASLKAPPPVDGDEARRAAAALRAQWRASPDDPTPGRVLFRLHLAASRPDAALVAASALIARGAADEEVEAFARRFRTRFLQRAIAPLQWSHVDAIRHRDDDRDLATLFTRLFAAAPPPSPPTQALTPIATEALPPAFAQVLGYVAWMLGVAAPRTFSDGAGDATLRVLSGPDTPVLAVPPPVLAITDKVALAFRLGRAMSALYPARAQAMALPSRRLKHYLAAASALLGAAGAGGELEPEARALLDRLRANAHLATEIKPTLERLAGRGAPINLSRWLRGLASTADRIGLVLCNDLPVAAKIVGDEGAAAADLVDFALSDEVMAVREAVGLTISV